MIKTFRGKLDNNSSDTIRLSTNNGLTGYKIKKFELIGIDPANTSQETTMKIFTVPQTTVTSTIDFSDQTLLAVGYYDSSSSQSYNPPAVVIFDNNIFNQDIYITGIDSNSAPVSYTHLALPTIYSV